MNADSPPDFNSGSGFKIKSSSRFFTSNSLAVNQSIPFSLGGTIHHFQMTFGGGHNQYQYNTGSAKEGKGKTSYFGHHLKSNE
jgi:hypothetical protein